MPIVLVAVALYFAFAPDLAEGQRARLSSGCFAATFAPAIGFYDSAIRPGAGSFYMISLVVLVGFGLTRAIAGARFANFGSNTGSLAIFALFGHIFLFVGLAMGAGRFSARGSEARSARRFGARLVRPIIVVVSRTMALRLMAAPGGLVASVWKLKFGG